jgi:hypothetical protein
MEGQAKEYEQQSEPLKFSAYGPAAVDEAADFYRSPAASRVRAFGSRCALS